MKRDIEGNLKLAYTSAFLVCVGLVETLFVTYLTNYGLRIEASSPVSAMGLPSSMLLALPPIAVLILTAALWAAVMERAPSLPLGSKRMDVDRVSWLWRLRGFSFALSIFAVALLLPYVIGSSWFWSIMGKLASQSQQLAGWTQSFYSSTSWVMSIDPIWKYALSQNLASLLMAVTAMVVSRRPRSRLRRR